MMEELHPSVVEFRRALATLPPEQRALVCDRRSSGNAEAWNLRDAEGLLVARVPITALRQQKRAPAAMQLRGASILHVTKTNDDSREISGIATRAELDRVGDIVVSEGVRFHNPTPLLLGHDHSKPVGQVWFTPGKGEIRFRAKLPRIEEPPQLRDRVEEAYASVRTGLIAAVSIGFRVLPDGAEPLPGGGWRYTKTEILELSLVACPALPSAVITGVRSVDAKINKHLRRGAAGDDSLEEQARDLRRSKRLENKAPATQGMLLAAMDEIIGALGGLHNRIKALEGKR